VRPVAEAMTLDGVMRLADSYADGPHEQGYYGARREALRAAIEQYARGDAEPAAWLSSHAGIPVSATTQEREAARWRRDGVTAHSLYTRPSRPSRPLTDEQIDAIFDAHRDAPTLAYRYLVARAIERAHGIEPCKQ